MERQKRVLVVDDDASFRGAVVRMLPKTFDVTTAGDGEEAIARIMTDQSFDLVVMDLDMPRMDGRAAHARLEELAPALARRTLIMTGGSNILAMRDWVDELGPTRLLLKPFSAARLRSAIDSLFADIEGRVA